MEMQIRFLKIEQGLQTAGPQTQRQVQKLMNRLEELVNEFIKKGDLNDKDMERLMKYTTEIDAFEKKFAELVDINMVPVTELHRYLFTTEPLFPQLTYNSVIPELGPVRVTFSKEVADLFNQTDSIYRKSVFPLIFRGLVKKQGQNGIKAFTGGHAVEKEINGVVYKLMELKKLGNEGRIILISTSTGELHFYKFIGNHHRIDYLAKEDFIKNFLNNHN
ncbi:MAG: hypothetical protein M9899_03060 [Bdellovibrionaceae bacterium]|nr:hypothetical protein [Pseudobdellovibrionaceae bacterium]